MGFLLKKYSPIVKVSIKDVTLNNNIVEKLSTSEHPTKELLKVANNSLIPILPGTIFIKAAIFLIKTKNMAKLISTLIPIT